MQDGAEKGFCMATDDTRKLIRVVKEEAIPRTEG
jgi:hypothetical protein